MGEESLSPISRGRPGAPRWRPLPWAGPGALVVWLLLVFVAVACQATPDGAEANPTVAGRENPLTVASPEVTERAIGGGPGQAAPREVSPTVAPTAVPTPTETPFVPRLQPLTESGCCTNPGWMPDSQGIYFYDRADDGTLGTWVVSVQDGSRTFLTPHYGFFTPDLSLVAIPDRQAGVTRVFRIGDGASWTIPNRANPTYISPDGSHVVYTVSPPISGATVFNRRPSEVWIANLDGGEAHQIATIYGGTPQWFRDGRRLLTSGRSRPEEDSGLWTIDAETGALRRIATADRILSTALSPTGDHVVYLVAMAPAEEQNGLWLAATDGSGARRLDFLGSVRWAPDGRSVVYVPLRTERGPDSLWRYDLATGQQTALTDPTATPFLVANGDWELSPDGKSAVFVSSPEQRIQVITFLP